MKKLISALSTFVVSAAVFSTPVDVFAEMDHSQHMNHSAHMDNSGSMDHSAHMAMMEKSQERSVENYTLPRVKLIDQNGTEKDFESFLDPDKVVVINFIFTTCTTICPVLSAGSVNFSRKLGDDADNVQFISITIDPEHDKPDVLKAYSQKYKMEAGHLLLTGSRADINEVMKAFNAVMPDKMTHYPLTFFRASGETQEWVRVFGMMSVSDMVGEYESLTKS
jgi:protein SCO1/2